EGWEAPPTLFALVPTELVVDQIELDDSSAPLTLVVQDNLPDNILPGSEELAEYVSRIAWPRQVEGGVLAQEIVFKDTSAPDAEPDRNRTRLDSSHVSISLLSLHDALPIWNWSSTKSSWMTPLPR